MPWGKSHKEKKSTLKSSITGQAASAGERDIKGELEAAKVAAQKAFDSHRRFWFHDVLKDAYSIYIDWKEGRQSKKNAKRAASFYGVKIKKGAHPLAAIIKIVTPTGVDTRRWVDGLRYALKNGIPPNELITFLKEHGGIAGCARRLHA
jgi:hypothetical protein